MIIQETTKMSEREKMAARNSNFCYLLNALYPVGSIYVSKDPTDPAELFGGSWKRIKERFIWAIGDNENPGDTGGEKTHTLTEAELPKLSGSILNFALQEQGQSVSTSGVFSTRASQEWATYGSNGKYRTAILLIFPQEADKHTTICPRGKVSISGKGLSLTCLWAALPVCCLLTKPTIPKAPTHRAA